MSKQNQEELQKQQQFMQQQQAMMQKYQMLQFIGYVIKSLDKKDILQTISRQIGPVLYCADPYTSQQLSTRILQMIEDANDENFCIRAQNILLNAMNLTNQIRSNLMMQGGNGAMNPMMGGMGMGMSMGMMGGMGMPGMMGGMNPMMGMGMGMPGMMGMNYGMGMMGMNQMQQPTNTQAEDNKAENAKNYLKTYIYQTDPIIYLTLIINDGVEIDFTEDKVFEDILTNALFNSICNMSNRNPMIFNNLYYVAQSLYQTDYYAKMNKNGNGQQQPMNFGMMGGMGMPGMMGGMNPMMGMGMPMGMPGAMNGMMTGFDMNGMGGMNPMMGGMGMGMPGMMGMNFGMMNMPGMTGTTAMPGMNTANNLV